jgi:hypothetical protein
MHLFMSSFEVLHPHCLGPILFASCELQTQILEHLLVHGLCCSSNTKTQLAKWPGVHFPYIILTQPILTLVSNDFSPKSGALMCLFKSYYYHLINIVAQNHVGSSTLASALNNCKAPNVLVSEKCSTFFGSGHHAQTVSHTHAAILSKSNRQYTRQR